jgi:hypothetical protein
MRTFPPVASRKRMLASGAIVNRSAKKTSTVCGDGRKSFGMSSLHVVFEVADGLFNR